MLGITASTNAIGERTSASYAVCHCSRVKPSASGSPGGPPVFVTRMSIGPRKCSTSCTRIGTPSRFALSWTKPVASIVFAAA